MVSYTASEFGEQADSERDSMSGLRCVNLGKVEVKAFLMLELIIMEFGD